MIFKSSTELNNYSDVPLKGSYCNNARNTDAKMASLKINRYITLHKPKYVDSRDVNSLLPNIIAEDNNKQSHISRCGSY